MTSIQTKTCTRCLLNKPRDAFRRDPRATGQKPSQGGLGIKSRCRACELVQERAYATKHRERRRLACAAWNASAKGPQSQRAYRMANRDSINAKNRARRKADLERYRAYEKTYRAKGPTVKAANQRAKRRTPEGRAKRRAYYAKKREHFMAYRAQHKEAIRKTNRAWALRNKGLMAALRFKRIAAQQQALPKWADVAAMKAIYKDAARLTQQTGIRHEVDHIIPLRSPIVCGLHVPANLQILTKTANRKKWNYFHEFVSAA